MQNKLPFPQMDHMPIENTKKKPMTPAERMKKYRSRLSAEKAYEIWKKVQKTREIEDLDGIIAEDEQKQRNQETMAEMRKHKQASDNQQTTDSSPSKSFASPQSFGKALQRVKKVLSQSPKKKEAVVKKLSQSFGFINRVTHRRLPDENAETRNKVVKFYESDLISRQSPGMKHFITIKQEGKKTTVQKRILNMNVMEAYRLFKEENPRLK